MGLLRGNKFNSCYFIVVLGVKEFFKVLKKNDGVKKIVFGEISFIKVNVLCWVKVCSCNGNFMVILFCDVFVIQVFNIIVVEGFVDFVVVSIEIFIF